MEEFTWIGLTVETLYRVMDQKLYITHPPFKRAVGLFSKLKMGPNKSFVQYHEHKKWAMLKGGIGTREGFDLSLD